MEDAARTAGWEKSPWWETEGNGLINNCRNRKGEMSQPLMVGWRVLTLLFHSTHSSISISSLSTPSYPHHDLSFACQNWHIRHKSKAALAKHDVIVWRKSRGLSTRLKFQLYSIFDAPENERIRRTKIISIISGTWIVLGQFKRNNRNTMVLWCQEVKNKTFIIHFDPSYFNKDRTDNWTFKVHL